MKLQILTALLIIGIAINAQNVAFKKKNFEDQEAFKIAQKNLKEGNKKYIIKEYYDALPYFIKANDFNPNNAELNFKIGISYLKSEEPEKSLKYFKKAKELDPEVHPLLEFGLAQANQYNKQYADAINGYNTFLSGLSIAEKEGYETKVNSKIKECKDAGGENTIIEIKEEKPTTEIAENTETEEIKKTEETETIEKPEPFDPDKKKEYVPVNAHPVNTEPVKPVKKQKEIKQEKITPVAKPKPVKKQEVKPVTSANFTYKVQLSSSSRKLTTKEKKALYTGSIKLQEEYVNNKYKYLLGNFKTKDEALRLRSKINVNGAFIVKYKNGKRIVAN